MPVCRVALSRSHPAEALMDDYATKMLSVLSNGFNENVSLDAVRRKLISRERVKLEERVGLVHTVSGHLTQGPVKR